MPGCATDPTLDHGAPGIGYPQGIGITSGIYWQYAQRARTLESVTVHQTIEMTVIGDAGAESRHEVPPPVAGAGTRAGRRALREHNHLPAIKQLLLR